MAEKNIAHIYTVSKLTRQIKDLLEEKYPFVWVCGEISNHTVPVSGHAYFTLKDTGAVISCVMFKNQRRNLKFDPGNGMKVFGLARLTLYEPRGNYQLIFEHLEPEGTGALQIAFEQLKEKLKDKGYFDEKFKKSIPFLPACVSVITSKTGAALKDILHVSQRRFPNCRIDILPVKVQGDEAADEICRAVDVANQYLESDLIIIARGGGSLEDLMAFNSEAVAESIFNSTIPIITGIGHETDFTIADFVADLRAPTPSAAAELAFPDKESLLYTIESLSDRLDHSMSKRLTHEYEQVDRLTRRLRSPEMIIYHSMLSLDDLKNRLSHTMTTMIEKHKTRVQWLAHSLETLNPFDVLKRGYSITRTLPEKQLVTDSKNVATSDTIEIILSNGKLTAEVKQAHG